MANLYSQSSVDRFVNSLVEDGYEVHTIEGCLNDGYICVPPDDKHYGFEFKVVYLNEWSSALSMRRFSKLSKRQEKIISELLS